MAIKPTRDIYIFYWSDNLLPTKMRLKCLVWKVIRFHSLSRVTVLAANEGRAAWQQYTVQIAHCSVKRGKLSEKLETFGHAL